MIIKEVWIGRVSVNFVNHQWVWEPYAQKSILSLQDGQYRVIYSETNTHTISVNVTDLFDNEAAAFEAAKRLLESYTSKQMQETEWQYEKMWANLPKDSDFNFDNKKPRKIWKEQK